MASMLIISCRRSSLYRSPEALWIDAARKMPGNARAYDNIGAAMLRESPPRYDSADSLFVRAIALNSTFIEPRRRRASVAIAQGRAGDAEQLLLHVLNIAPNDSAAISMLGKVYLVAREPARALPYLRRIANESSDPSAFGDLGNAFVMMGQLDSAAAALRLAILRNPNNPDPLRWLGAALVEAGRGSEAVPYLERSLTLDSTSGVAYGLLSIAFGQARWADSAEHAAAAASIHASGNAVVLVLAGRGLQAAGRVEQAIPYYAAAIQLTPNDPEALTRFGIAEASLGHAREAVTLFNRALAASPNYPPALQALRAMHRTSVASP
jgi:tetratricopeptide (TPR) repeat protein